jgi:CRISPR-associated endonuclease/helicase Cas3
MMVTFVSQCEKKSLSKTRRVLDAFANRIGDNVWQTIITEDGLIAVKKLLRRTASKNTAVVCHWLRSRSRSDVLWVVGNRNKFNSQGVVPVNSTRRQILNNTSENTWQYAKTIQIIAVIAALLHDIGKATLGFQDKLKPKSKFRYGDPYRHEWISMRLFQAIIKGCESDQEWLLRLINYSGFVAANPRWQEQMPNDARKVNIRSVSDLPPLAQTISWLIVSHHRLPFYDLDYRKERVRKSAQNDLDYLCGDVAELYEDLRPVNSWVRNPKSCEEYADAGYDFWSFSTLPMESKVWQKDMARWAKKALNHPPLIELEGKTISNPFILQLSRLCLMTGDHNYSSLSANDRRRVNGDPDVKSKLIANTDFKTKAPKQALDEHLLGVGRFTAKFASLLPQLRKKFSGLDEAKVAAFANATKNPRFLWQNRAFDLAKKAQKNSESAGFFGINMASTGSGKTLANARIMAALADPTHGARFTIALGLRVLTLQTGLALRDRLNLGGSDLAVLVGGAANKTLFELNQTAGEQEPEHIQEGELLETYGSESLAEMVDGIVYSGELGVSPEELGTIVADQKARELLYAPIVTCTIDHMMAASEGMRGGKHIPPILRLLTSDLVLDEPDDFGQDDLPALSRIVHLAGMYGSRILLSSATLTPDLTAGLFEAYIQGRKIWNNANGIPQGGMICTWFDEYSQKQAQCVDNASFSLVNNKFIEKRSNNLSKESVRRKADILPVKLPTAKEGEKLNYESLVDIILAGAQDMHLSHHEVCPNTGKSVSVGLVRVANIRPLVALMRAINEATLVPSNTQIHLCCYHARQLLILRNGIEAKLDRILDRTNERSLFDHEEISKVVGANDYKHHIFIVLATPVAEVGRDHDYDWAIVEPSSQRSIIQLAGRIWRHRPKKVALKANMLIFESNINALSAGIGLGVGEAVFQRPGFESAPKFLLSSHKASDLISAQQLNHVNSTSRIIKTDCPDAARNLADLEHSVMADLLNNPKPNYVNTYWQKDTANRACVHLQRLTPFRRQTRRQDEFMCLPDDNESSGFSFKYSEQAWACLQAAPNQNQLIKHVSFTIDHDAVSPWLTCSLENALEQLGELLGEADLTRLAMRYATVRLEENQKGWNFSPYLGFWNN